MMRPHGFSQIGRMVNFNEMIICDGDCGDSVRTRPMPDAVMNMDIFKYHHIADFTDSFLGFIVQDVGGGGKFIGVKDRFQRLKS